MEKTYRKKHDLKVILSALLTFLLLMSAIFIMVSHVNNTYEYEALEKLHLETQQIKRDINLQIFSDRENLITMANFASKLYEDGENYELLFRSFQEIGLFEDVRILLPNNSFVSKNGTIPAVADLVFEEEIKKGRYVSGRVTDLVYGDKEVVRSAVPVVSNDGKTVAMIYGIIDLQKFENRYLDDIREIGADLFLVEQETGKFIIDTKRPGFGAVTELRQTTFEDGYSYEDLAQELASGEDGYVSFDSIVTGKKLYAHYAPVDFAPWQIMVAKPAEEVFNTARDIGAYMIVMAILLILIMMGYVFIVFVTERKNLTINTNASIIRKRLLEVNQNFDKMYEALKLVGVFAKARSVFFTDSYREEHVYIQDKLKDGLLVGNDREHFFQELFNYIAIKQSKRGTNVYLNVIRANKKLLEQNKELYEFLVNHGIRKIEIASVTHNNSNTSILGVVNSKKSQTAELLKDIAVCFAMSIYSKKHLTNTESMALTDALTGVANRMAYKNDIKKYQGRSLDNLTCIYIDVNELNYYNNQHGHAAGDQMLIFIADTLSGEFGKNNVYRMGGDEFLVFTEGVSRTEVVERISRANNAIEEMKYHISVGIKVKTDDINLEELVNEAEKRMYIEKTKYYQDKDTKTRDVQLLKSGGEVIETGKIEIDAYLSMLENKYYGIYYVSLDTDKAVYILASAYYFSLMEEENTFTGIVKRYIADLIRAEYQRTLFNFIQTDVIKAQLNEGQIPKLSFVRKDGGKVKLSVWPVDSKDNDINDTIWIFEKDN